MRIIGGTHKGLILHPPKGLPVRPTTDRARESFFNILSNHFDFNGLDVLDLFSGTGAMSAEFCSRGAASVRAVDIDKKCIDWFRSIAERPGMGALHPQRSDVYAWLRDCTDSFDIIFSDAPYSDKRIAEIPGLVHSNVLLKAGGWLVVEHESNLDLSGQSGYFDKRTYGQSAFSFFR